MDFRAEDFGWFTSAVDFFSPLPLLCAAAFVVGFMVSDVCCIICFCICEGPAPSAGMAGIPMLMRAFKARWMVSSFVGFVVTFASGLRLAAFMAAVLLEECCISGETFSRMLLFLRLNNDCSPAQRYTCSIIRSADV
jgi:hypothetical protein